MPKIFEYLGILIFFYSNEHEPIHVNLKVSRAKLNFISWMARSLKSKSNQSEDLDH